MLREYLRGAKTFVSTRFRALQAFIGKYVYPEIAGIVFMYSIIAYMMSSITATRWESKGEPCGDGILWPCMVHIYKMNLLVTLSASFVISMCAILTSENDSVTWTTKFTLVFALFAIPIVMLPALLLLSTILTPIMVWLHNTFDLSDIVRGTH